ncbi:MAG TPA: ATP synthase F1 subunit delta [Bacilli bacterium]|nr:ATP synthase F1 subunit delta [Bacilli bacterium]
MEGIATRYASGLLSLARADDAIRAYKDWMLVFDDILESNEQFKTFLTSEFISVAQKEALVDKINPSSFEYAGNFLKLLVAKKRINYFHAIKKEFVRLANIDLGIKEGVIYTPLTIEPPQLAAICKKIGALIGCEVELRIQIDKSLLGGFKVIVQGQIFDYSLNNRLAKLGQTMLERGDKHAH